MSERHDEAVRSGSELSELQRTLEREREKIRALQDIGAALGSTLDLNELLSMVLDRISKVMDADRSTLYLLDEDTDELWAKASQGERSYEIRLKVGEGLAGTVAETGRSLNIKDAYQDPRFDAEWDRRTGYRTRSTLCVPMKNHSGRTIGVVQVLNRKEGYFSRDDEAMLSALASQAAVSIENSKLFLSVVGKNIELLETQEQLERKIRELDVLFEIAQVSASAGALDELLHGLLARTMRAVDAEVASIFLADPISGDLHVRATVGSNEGSSQVISEGQGICGWVAKHQRPQVVNEVSARGPQVAEEFVGFNPRSVLCVPLSWTLSESRTGVGAVQLLNKARGRDPFKEDDVKLATVIAGHLSTAIAQAQDRQRRERQDRLATIGRFLSGVVHDFKSPMTLISNYVKMIAAEEKPEARTRLAGSVLRQVKLLDTMARQTLAFARGDRDLWVRKVYLYKFFEELVELLRPEMDAKKISIELVQHDRGIAHFDEQKLHRAILNLARNAIEAMPEGGAFRIEVAREQNDVLISCIDNGPGIPDEIRHHLFDSFTTHGKSGGSGLGLAIVKQIVTDHGGSIEVRSRSGETVFTVRLPQDARELRQSTESAERSLDA